MTTILAHLFYTEITSSGCRHVGGIEVANAKMIENTQRDIDIVS